jgi:single-strand DNA-binding protein
MSVNKVILVCNSVKHPEVKTVGDNKIASFSVATNERAYTTKDGKQVPEKVEFHNIVAWRGLAEMCEKWVIKGTQLYIEGKLTTRNYENKDGQKVYVTEVVANTIQLLGSKPEGASQGSKGASSKTEQYASEPPTDEPLPF